MMYSESPGMTERADCFPMTRKPELVIKFSCALSDKNKEPPFISGIPCVCTFARFRFIFLLSAIFQTRRQWRSTRSLCPCSISPDPGLVTRTSQFSSTIKRRANQGLRLNAPAWPKIHYSLKSLGTSYLYNIQNILDTDYIQGVPDLDYIQGISNLLYPGILKSRLSPGNFRPVLNPGNYIVVLISGHPVHSGNLRFTICRKSQVYAKCNQTQIQIISRKSKI